MLTLIDPAGHSLARVDFATMEQRVVAHELMPRNTSGPVTMSSREIADLVGSRHDNVRITIERLSYRGVIALPATQEKATGGRPSLEYVFYGPQGKRDSIIVVAQLSPEFTAVLVDRWQELEDAQQAPQPPAVNLNDPKTLRGLLLEYTTQTEQLQARVEQQAQQLAEDAPKVQAFDRFMDDEGLFGLREAEF